MWLQDELFLALFFNLIDTFSILVKASSMRAIRKSSTASKIFGDITNSPPLNNRCQHQHVFCCSPGEGGVQLQGMEVACSVGLTLAQHVRAQVLHAGDQDEDHVDDDD